MPQTISYHSRTEGRNARLNGPWSAALVHIQSRPNIQVVVQQSSTLCQPAPMAQQYCSLQSSQYTYGTGHIWHHIVNDPKFLKSRRIVRRQLNVSKHPPLSMLISIILLAPSPNHHPRSLPSAFDQPQVLVLNDNIRLHQSLRHNQILNNLSPYAARTSLEHRAIC